MSTKAYDLDKVLKLKIEGDNGKQTLREYLRALLLTVWREEEGFSGKRPFGNSGWQYDIYRVFIKNKLIKGKMDKGYIDELSYAEEQRGSDIVINAINHVFKEKNAKDN